MMHTQVTQGYRASGEARSDQGEVWREVDRKLTETGSMSGTAYLDKAYEDTEESMRPVLEQLAVPEGAVPGRRSLTAGRSSVWTCSTGPTTLASLWPKLLRT